jgi:catechol 2,3-dioxygenase-like lactoylglutathione lyase family enzyme
VTSRLTHVSVIARDIEASVEFYEAVLGMERIPTPRFHEQRDVGTGELDTAFLRCGDQQIHLWVEPDADPLRYNHFAVHVEEFEAAYRAAVEREAFAAVGERSAPPRVFRLDDSVQMYLTDPAGNLVEVDHPSFEALDASVFAEVIERDVTGPAPGVYLDSLRDRL